MRSTGAIVVVILVLLVGFAGCAGCGTYNSLVQKDTAVEEAWANVETAYQRRADLIPNLVSTVQGAADFERTTLQEVVDARARATSINISADDLDDPAAVEQYLAAQQQLSGALGRLLAVAENYPQLQATEAFRDLQVQLEGTENRINVARTRYNEAVRDYNTSVRSFPANLFAGLFGFDTRTPFEAEEGAEDAPDVEFQFD
ncbi:MAG TPA: LemA family protein [Rubricoccaceae bacterium]|jgi:LemA protein|nr:LemA family protein [Rubricoccaceae bacterium]